MAVIFFQMHKLKKLLDRIREHLPVVTASTVKYSSENEQLANQFGIILRVSSPSLFMLDSAFDCCSTIDTSSLGKIFDLPRCSE